MWNQLVQGHVDYCSQLWQSLQSTGLQRLENYFKIFLKKIPSLKNESYWNRLKILKINSQQRRLERYRVIYTWKALEGQVPECGIKSKSSEDSRLGRFCHVPTIVSKSSARVKTLREQLFQVHGPKLFNCLPKSIRKITGCDINKF